ncbi:MAG: T9SS type A sorting domain-containing protein, partial [Ignavibacteriae bacterium]|nr:T9SS type A sorting domain-containing protein [Ignavibacteriota bacterium]
TATIKFDIPENTQAEFSLFDVSGKKLTDIANSMYKAGQYKIIFDLSGFSSGIYFCRFRSAGYTNTIKLLLIK